MILTRQIFGIHEFWPNARVGQVLRKMMSLGDCLSGSAVLDKLAREHNCMQKLTSLDHKILELLHLCLTPNVFDRPSPEDLLRSDIFKGLLPDNLEILKYSPPAFPVMKLRCRDLSLKGE